MDNTNPNPEKTKAAYVKVIGKNLLEAYKKERFYSLSQVINAHEKYEWPEPYTPIWAMAIFCSQSDFDVYTAEIGESHDYSAMRIELMKAMNITNKDLQKESHDGNSSWLDWGAEGLVEGIIGGIPELFLGIFSP